MKELDLWRYKVLQMLHDPPGKPLAGWYRDPQHGRGHNALAEALMAALGADPNQDRSTRPDLAATGADRPNVGHGGIARVTWGQDQATPLATHPLCKAPLQLDGAKGQPRTLMPGESFPTQKEVISSLKISEPGWGDVATVRACHGRLWRRLRDELIGHRSGKGAADGASRLLWSRMPADTRAPDHSIWEHNRLTSALAFMEGPTRVPLHAAREPMLLSFSLGPVQEFIAEARTGRDLWTGSMLLADLAWRSMLPVVRRYGPDAVLSPDLRGNPMVDRWLADHPETFGSLVDGDPFTYAAMLPHHWIAVLPRGGDGHLLELDRLAKECQAAVQERWDNLAIAVSDRLAKASQQVGVAPTEWRQDWDHQHRQVIHVTWVAVPWDHHAGMDGWTVGGALPAQDLSGAPGGMSDEQRVGLAERERRLRPWVPEATWARYEAAREVFARTHAVYLKSERGFDYALTHHRLQVWHNQRKAARVYPREAEAASDRCTVCGRRAALGPRTDARRPLDGQRSTLREFWKKLGKALSEPAWGEERLCGVCVFKRLLVPLGTPEVDVDDFNQVWTGAKVDVARSPTDERLRAPFPSTSAVASQRFLREVCSDPSLASTRATVADEARRVAWPRTLFSRALSSLADLPAEPFLELEPQVLSTGARAAELDRMGKSPADQRPLARAVSTLLDAAAKLNIRPPSSRFALLALDGDGLGRLLLGDAERMKAAWRDVLHPLAAKQLATNPTAVQAGWAAMLDRERLAGPALHAFVSRALADFAHRIVPWVVEREFHGRLIFTGGDDVLAMVDAEDALLVAARLQQLYAAPWVVDTRPGDPPWKHRHHREIEAWSPDRDRGRFVIPRWGDAPMALSSAEIIDPVRPEGAPVPAAPAGGLDGEVLGLLGPHQSLSAGIVFAHFKTPLRGVIRAAHAMLDHKAKEEEGRAAFAAALWTRGGVKASCALRWYAAADPSRADAPDGHQILVRARDAFREGKLPGRLPYKLREVAWAVDAACKEPSDQAELDRLRRGLLTHALRDAGLREGLPIFEDVDKLWSRDLQAGGLLLARGLARDAGDEEAET